MNFKNPTFKEGLNLTIRRGANMNSLRRGNTIWLRRGDLDSPVGKGIVNYIKILRFRDISPNDLEFHHSIKKDSPKKTFAAIYQEMTEYYEEFGLDEIVTLIFFEVKK